MKRIYHPWDKWEDYRHNFYGGVTSDYPKDNTLTRYADFLRDLTGFEEALKVVISEWKYSCEHNLSNESMNRVAYLGQAAMALAFKVPHSQSMGGYNLLTPEQQRAADTLAQRYLGLWISKHEKETSDVNTQKV